MLAIGHFNKVNPENSITLTCEHEITSNSRKTPVTSTIAHKNELGNLVGLQKNGFPQDTFLKVPLCCINTTLPPRVATTITVSVTTAVAYMGKSSSSFFHNKSPLYKKQELN